MNKLSSIEIVCVRHGKTNYTGQPLDLTPEGKAHVCQVAIDKILPWVKKNNVDLRELEILSSPAPRAHYTAWLIGDAIGHQGSLLPKTQLGPMDRRDAIRAAEVYRQLGAGSCHVSYETDPVFQDPTIFETPTEVRTRWYAFLAEYINHENQPAIFVSHYEVLCNIVYDVFGIKATQKTELQHAEPIYLSVSPFPNSNTYVAIDGQFRDKKAVVLFNLFDHSIERHI